MGLCRGTLLTAPCVLALCPNQLPTTLPDAPLTLTAQLCTSQPILIFFF